MSFADLLDMANKHAAKTGRRQRVERHHNGLGWFWRVREVSYTPEISGNEKKEK